MGLCDCPVSQVASRRTRTVYRRGRLWSVSWVENGEKRYAHGFKRLAASLVEELFGEELRRRVA